LSKKIPERKTGPLLEVFSVPSLPEELIISFKKTPEQPDFSYRLKAMGFFPTMKING